MDATTANGQLTSSDTSLRTIRLLGELGQKFGRIHQLAVATPAEAIRALCSQLAGFREYVSSGERRYRVAVGSVPIREVDELRMGAGEHKAFTFVPVLHGGKSAWGQIIVGGLLIAAATFNPLGFFGGTALLSGWVGTAAIGIGSSLVLGGISQLISPKPQTPQASETKNNPSYIYNGGVNTSQQGQCVPLGYGRMRVGSAVISAGISSKDIPV